jgi:hypothetical protein
VTARLVAVFRALPGTAASSPRKGVFEPSRPIDGLDLTAAVQLCLGRQSPGFTGCCYGAHGGRDRRVGSLVLQAAAVRARASIGGSAKSPRSWTLSAVAR